MLKTVVFLAALCFIVPVVARAEDFAPAAVEHALRLQVEGSGNARAADVGVACTNASMRSNNEQSSADRDNRDWLALASSQQISSTGFAQCALNAGTSQAFTVFAGACLNAMIDVLVADVAMYGHFSEIDRAKAAQARVIATWLKTAPNAGQTERRIADDALGALAEAKL